MPSYCNVSYICEALLIKCRSSWVGLSRLHGRGVNVLSIIILSKLTFKAFRLCLMLLQRQVQVLILCNLANQVSLCYIHCLVRRIVFSVVCRTTQLHNTLICPSNETPPRCVGSPIDSQIYASPQRSFRGATSAFQYRLRSDVTAE